MNDLSIIMMVISILFLYMIFRDINKNKITLEYAKLWSLIGFIMLFLSFSGEFTKWLGQALGFELLSNFLLVGAVLFLIIHSFIQAKQLSKNKIQITSLIQEVSLLKKEMKEKKLASKNEEGL